MVGAYSNCTSITIFCQVADDASVRDDADIHIIDGDQLPSNGIRAMLKP
jgi:hypothetical protein